MSIGRTSGICSARSFRIRMHNKPTFTRRQMHYSCARQTIRAEIRLGQPYAIGWKELVERDDACVAVHGDHEAFL